MGVKGLYQVLMCRDEEGRQQNLEMKSNHKIPTEAVMEMIGTVLESNYFDFNGSNHLQVDVTAIGSKLR